MLKSLERDREPGSGRPAATVWLGALGAIAAVTACGRLVPLNTSTVGFGYLLVALLGSVRGGLPLGTACSLVAALAYNYFFFPPLYTLTIHEPENWVALGAFLVASVVVSRLVVAARSRTADLETLHGLSVDLFGAAEHTAALGHALELLGAAEGGLVLFEAEPASGAVRWWRGEEPPGLAGALAELERRRAPLELASPLGRDVYLPLLVGDKITGALVARGTETSLQALEPAARLFALAIERERLLAERAHLAALQESEALKTSLLRAVSHDLTTPITAITIQIEALRRSAGAEAVAALEAETARLRRRIENLLAMARLEAKAEAHREPTPPADLFRAVRENLPLVFGARPVSVHVDDDCPEADVDPSLALEVLVNLVENAHRASPPGAPIELLASRRPGGVRLEVLDRGPGMPPAADSAAARPGLGLRIARGLTTANGGSLDLAPRDGGGTAARVDLPAA